MFKESIITLAIAAILSACFIGGGLYVTKKGAHEAGNALAFGLKVKTIAGRD